MFKYKKSLVGKASVSLIVVVFVFLGIFLSFYRATAAGTSIICYPPSASQSTGETDAYGKEMYDVNLNCSVYASPTARVIISYPQKYTGVDWRHGDTLPYNWGFLTYSAFSWNCQDVTYQGINCTPHPTYPLSNGGAANRMDLLFRAIGQCGTTANVAASTFAGNDTSPHAYDSSWDNFPVAFPACSTSSSTNPVPTITSISPSSKNAGDGAFTLTANGTNYISTSTIYFDSAALSTTYISATQLTGSVPASYISSSGTHAITVVNPSPGGGTSNSVTFTVNSSNPSVETKAATNILNNSATLNGWLNSLGNDSSSSVWFQWGTSTSYGFETSHITKTFTGPFSGSISSLTPNTVYHFRAVAQNGFGTSYGSDMSFTSGNTLSLASVQTLDATNILTNSVTLNGKISSLGGDTSGQVFFQWGLTAAYGNSTNNQTVTSAQQFSQTVTGLSSGTTYHFRAGATTDAGTVYGSDFSFTTGSITCSSSSDCGTNGLTGSAFCQNGNVYQNYKTYTCNNPGTGSSTCSNSTVAQLQTTCNTNQTCSNGTCTTTASNLTASCAASPNSASTNQSVTFIPVVSGGTGSYAYQWSNACTGFSQNCSNAFSSAGTHTTLLQVTSGSQTVNTSCSVTVNQPACSANSQCGTSGFTGSSYCNGNGVYRNYTTYTCNNAGASNSYCSTSTSAQLQNTCLSSQTCSNGSCVSQNITCSSNSDCGTNGYIDGTYCSSNNVYQQYKTYTCNNAGTSNSYCSNSTNSQLRQTCSNNQTCSSGSCASSCNSHSYQACVGSAVYWYDSCGNQQGLHQTCSANQTCQNNSCVNATQPQKTISGTERVRNLTLGNMNWAASITANPSDLLEFQVTLQNLTNQTINNVTVREIFPANLYYRDNLTIDGISNAGDITAGVNIGSFSPNQTRIITYQAQVGPTQNFSFGTTIIYDPVDVNSTDPNYYKTPVDPASISVTKTGIQGATNVSTGFTNNLLFDSFFIPLVLAAILFWVFKSGMLPIPAWMNLGKMGKNFTAKKQLDKRISEIKRKDLFS